MGSAITGIIGAFQSQAQRDQAQSAMDRAAAAVNAVGAPPDLAAQIYISNLKSAGVLTPELEQGINLQASKVAAIQEQAAPVAAQNQALQQLQQASQTGLNAQDRANYNQIRNQTQQDTQGRQQAIMQNMQARGQAGGGAELAAQLSNAQAGSNQQSQGGEQMAGAASQRALQALGQYGQMAGQVRGQNFGIAQTKANAADLVNQFNTQQAIQRQQRNVQNQNAAQASNLQNAQNLSNANTMMGNQELYRQNQAKQQMYQDSMSHAQALSNANLGQAGQYNANAAQTAQQWNNIGGGMDTAIGAYANNSAKSSPNGTTSTQEGSTSGVGPVANGDQYASDLGGYWEGGEVKGFNQGGKVDGDQQDMNDFASLVGMFNKGGKVPCYYEGGTAGPTYAGYADGGQIPQQPQQQSNPMGFLNRLPQQPQQQQSYKSGGKVPGKPKVPGDSPKNDTVSARLSPGEIVVPNSHSDDPEKAAAFARLIAEHNKRFKKKG